MSYFALLKNTLTRNYLNSNSFDNIPNAVNLQWRSKIYHPLESKIFTIRNRKSKPLYSCMQNLIVLISYLHIARLKSNILAFGGRGVIVPFDITASTSCNWNPAFWKQFALIVMTSITQDCACRIMFPCWSVGITGGFPCVWPVPGWLCGGAGRLGFRGNGGRLAGCVGWPAGCPAGPVCGGCACDILTSSKPENNMFLYGLNW